MFSTVNLDVYVLVGFVRALCTTDPSNKYCARINTINQRQTNCMTTIERALCVFCWIFLCAKYPAIDIMNMHKLRIEFEKF